ncbi:NAD(P)/FAD-dependent oxidoreductase [Salinivibrio socompensis]|uniref:NAD(P)/FAD-dependent oxidoreductase n=1 Tax=Salinivibrio socompensis TaxID=1510206 RepID=UPI0004726E68|nr:NAD(P)/FAD-dependent oxidoreductase [Salinivibrio socompensis]
MTEYDVIVIGAGAAGLMCAAQAGQRGRRVLVVDHAKKPGRKILISGGGRCNFTNYDVTANNFLCENPHFVKSALAQYTQWDFIGLVATYGVAYHERDHGQLFCDDSAKDIVNLLLAECDQPTISQRYRCEVHDIEQEDTGFRLKLNGDPVRCQSLVVATGGLSMPKLGATPFGYQLAEQFGLKVLPTRAALVPYTLHQEDKTRFADISGVSVPCSITTESGVCFSENLLFTHRGLSGPAVLQTSSFWQPGEAVTIDLLPSESLKDVLVAMRDKHPNQTLKTSLARLFPKRLVEILIARDNLPDKPLKQLDDKQIDELHHYVHQWSIAPNGTEGYRTAEVTLGGVDTHAISSKTLEARDIPGLYFIGEVLDVTGWLGGYNFQWAWSSGWVAGQYV